MSRRKSGGARTARTETITVRLDPSLRYLAEVAARTQRRTLSSYVEWAIEESLSRVWVNSSATISDLAQTLWDVDEPDRLVKLAIIAPELLNFDEQVLWKLISENAFFWKGDWIVDPQNDDLERFVWEINEKTIKFAAVREHWDDLLAVVSGEKKASELPTFKTSRPSEIAF